MGKNGNGENRGSCTYPGCGCKDFMISRNDVAGLSCGYCGHYSAQHLLLDGRGSSYSSVPSPYGAVPSPYGAPAPANPQRGLPPQMGIPGSTPGGALPPAYPTSSQNPLPPPQQGMPAAPMSSPWPGAQQRPLAPPVYNPQKPLPPPQQGMPAAAVPMSSPWPGAQQRPLAPAQQGMPAAPMSAPWPGPQQKPLPSPQQGMPAASVPMSSPWPGAQQKPLAPLPEVGVPGSTPGGSFGGGLYPEVSESVPEIHYQPLSGDKFVVSQQSPQQPISQMPEGQEEDPFAMHSAPGGRFGGRDQKPKSPAVVTQPAPVAAPATEFGGWAIGTIETIKGMIPDISDETLVRVMTSVEPSKGIDELVDRCFSFNPDSDTPGGGGSQPAEKDWPADVVDTLAAALPETVSRERIERVLASFHPRGDVDAVLAFLFSEEDSVPSFECALCMIEFKVDQMYTVDCPSSHRFCFECIGRYVEMGIRENTRLMCQAEGCDHELTELEVEQISHGPGSPVTKEMVEKYKNQMLMRAVQSIPGIVGCPTPGCGNWIIPADITRKERCYCSACHASFCSLCKAPYHYGCDCATVRVIQQRWMEWVTSGRMRYNRDKKDALDKISAARAEIDRRNAEMMKKYNDMLADEEFKRKNGRYCPKCHRVIIKDGGCDLMVCGRNYHGGNIQDGCGTHFNWTEAKPYTSTLPKPNEIQQQVEIPEIAREFVHLGVSCDICHKEIKGLRFRCINCPSCDFCEKCEMQGTMAHEKDHLFEIISREQYG